MRHSLALVVLGLTALMLSGCTGSWAGPNARKAQQTAPAPPSDSEIVASHLEVMNRLSAAPSTEQAGMFESVQRMYLESPSPTRRLRYACMLAVPGHGGSDPAAALSLLNDLIAAPIGLGPAELALAQALRLEVGARLSLQAAVLEARAAADGVESDRVAAANRRIQAQAAENARLKKELDEALAKLEAIAELERSLVNRPAPGGERP